PSTDSFLPSSSLDTVAHVPSIFSCSLSALSFASAAASRPAARLSNSILFMTNLLRQGVPIPPVSLPQPHALSTRMARGTRAATQLSRPVTGYRAGVPRRRGAPGRTTQEGDHAVRLAGGRGGGPARGLCQLRRLRPAG